MEDIPDSKAHELKIEVSFNIDSDAILSVIARIINLNNYTEENKKNYKSFDVFGRVLSGTLKAKDVIKIMG